MQSINSVNKMNDLYVSPSKVANRNTPNMKHLPSRSVLHKKVATAPVNGQLKNFEFLDSKHLELLDLNKNIQSILPKPTKPLINLETVCKATVNSLMKKQNSMGMTKAPITNNTSANRNILNSSISTLPNKNCNAITTSTVAGNGTNFFGTMQQNEANNVKHLYELGAPQIVGTYIQPMNKNNIIINSLGTSFSSLNSSSMSNVSLPASPFFQPPNNIMPMTTSTFIPPTNSFLPFPYNKENSMYEVSSYLLPQKKPQNLTVTVIPNKDKEILEEEAKQLKLLLDNSSQGIVNSNPDYQTISPPILFGSSERVDKTNENENRNDNRCDNRNDNANNSIGKNDNTNNTSNDGKSDFSFGQQENAENLYGDFNNNYEEFMNQTNFYNTLNNENENSDNFNGNHNAVEEDYRSRDKHNHPQFYSEPTEEYGQNEYGHYSNFTNRSMNGSYYSVEASEQIRQNKKDKSKENFENSDQPDSEGNMKIKANQEYKKNKSGIMKNVLQKKESSSSICPKKYEPTVSFKNSKKYINIRLGRPKHPYITNSSDPIDKKLKEWHNSHNSQIRWKKNKRGVYIFGKTEVTLSLVHDKILVKKIDGQVVKDNLLSVEKFVSLNELNELQREEDQSRELS